MKVVSFLARRAFKQIQWINKQDKVEAEKLLNPGHLLIIALCHRIPAFISINIASILMVRAVADSPAVERYQQRCMAKMANQII